MGMIEFGPHEEIKKLYNTPVNRRLKYCALGAISVSIALMIIMIIWMDEISAKMKLFMRGCAGLCAIVFEFYVAVLYIASTVPGSDRNKRVSRLYNT